MPTLLYTYVEELVLIGGGKGLVDTGGFAGLTTAQTHPDKGENVTIIATFWTKHCIVGILHLLIYLHIRRQAGRGGVRTPGFPCA